MVEHSNIPSPHLDDEATITVHGATYQKHGTHWYTDGNLIVLVEKVAFRVFQSFLTRRSAVMESMLVAPDPKQPTENATATQTQKTTFDGASVVKLDDDADDFGLLLDVVLPQTCATAPISTKTAVFDLFGLARLAQRFKMSDVVTQVVSLLEQVLPTLERPHRSIRPAHAPLVIGLSRRCGFQQFLPMAFYYFATGELEYDSTNPRFMTMLTPRDKLRAQRGLVQLQETVIRLALTRWENCPIEGSRPEKACPRTPLICWMEYGGAAWPSGDNGTRWTNLLQHPLEELSMRANGKVTTFRLVCGSCRNEFIVANTLMITDIVKELGTIFGLQDESSLFEASPQWRSV